MSFAENGFDIVPEGLTAQELAVLSAEFPPEAPNRRNLFLFSPALENLVTRGGFSRLAQEILGERCFAIRAIFFNKIPKTNWHVPWHQDVGIPIREKREVAGFSAFTRKDGILHANAPTSVLEGLLTLRLHLDDCTAANGAMKLLPGSHRHGRVPEAAVDAIVAASVPAQPEIAAGGILRLRPLLFHASAHSSSDRPRRVIHIEYAAADLPGGLEWATRVYPA